MQISHLVSPIASYKPDRPLLQLPLGSWGLLVFCIQRQTTEKSGGGPAAEDLLADSGEKAAAGGGIQVVYWRVRSHSGEICMALGSRGLHASACSILWGRGRPACPCPT